jgi:hypothetical protein
MPQPRPCLPVAALPPSATAWFISPALDAAALLSHPRRLGKGLHDSCRQGVHHRRQPGGQHATEDGMQERHTKRRCAVLPALAVTQPEKDLYDANIDGTTSERHGGRGEPKSTMRVAILI